MLAARKGLFGFVVEAGVSGESLLGAWRKGDPL